MEICLFVVFTYWSHLDPLKEYTEALQIFEDNHIFLHPLSDLTPAASAVPHMTVMSIVALGCLWFMRKHDVWPWTECSKWGQASTEHTVWQLHLLDKILFLLPHIISVFLATIPFRWSSLELTYLLSTSSQIAVSRNANLLDIIAMPYLKKYLVLTQVCEILIQS